MPIMYALEVIGGGADPGRTTRRLIALLVCGLDPIALVEVSRARVEIENLLRSRRKSPIIADYKKAVI